jgi:hypothetical protein
MTIDENNRVSGFFVPQGHATTRIIYTMEIAQMFPMAQYPTPQEWEKSAVGEGSQRVNETKCAGAGSTTLGDVLAIADAIFGAKGSASR